MPGSLGLTQMSRQTEAPTTKYMMAMSANIYICIIMPCAEIGGLMGLPTSIISRMEKYIFNVREPRIQTATLGQKQPRRETKNKTACSLMAGVDQQSMELSYYRDIPLASTKRNKKFKKLKDLVEPCIRERKLAKESEWASKNGGVWKLRLEGRQISNSKYHEHKTHKTITIPLKNVPAVGDYENSDAMVRKKITFGYTFRGRNS